MDYQSIFALTGRNAIVVGGAAGIGEAVCEGYADFGANVAVVDRDGDGAETVAARLREKGVGSIALACDVTNSGQVKAVARTVAKAFGNIDILFNSAGIGKRCEMAVMPDGIFDDVMQVNLYGVFYFCREVGAIMLEQGRGGKIINMASISAYVGIPNTVNYCASKGGVVALSRCLATEWAPYNITVNSISPSHIRTAMIQRVMDTDPSKEDFFRNNILLGRIGEVQDVVGGAIYLAAAAGDFVTGTSLIIDGGHSAR